MSVGWRGRPRPAVYQENLDGVLEPPADSRIILLVSFKYVAPASHRLWPGFPLLVLALASLLPTPATGRNRHSTALFALDSEYAPALAAANRFLQAWQNQDHETGLLMLTDIAKQNSSQDRMENFFSCGTNGAYEIARGRKLKAGRYAFPVTLFASRAEPGKSGRPQRSAIVVVRAGKEEWAIEKLP